MLKIRGENHEKKFINDINVIYYNRVSTFLKSKKRESY